MDETQQPAPPAAQVSPHARMKELQAIPDRQRTDAEWDELNDLEIKLASVNRQGAPMPNAQHQRQGGGGQGQRNDQRRGGRNDQRKKFHGRRQRPG
ncbi:MAG: hypothetical protein IT513_05305 [Burkholderiales bacterium]|nr:hypothetical protein [Burkholderiales bacterium]